MKLSEHTGSRRLITGFISVVALICMHCSQSFAMLGMHGVKTVTTTNQIVNEYTTLKTNASAFSSIIIVDSSSLNSNSRFTGSLAAGELIMIIQMQGATIKTTDSMASDWGSITAYNNAGSYEFDEVASVPNATTINLVSPLQHSYTVSGKVQVIRVPRYKTFTINSTASVSAPTWNGSTGGVIAIEDSGAAVINGSINASGLGFRGGVLKQNSTCCPGGAGIALLYATRYNFYGAEKGESIAGDTTVYKALNGRYGRGAAANGGGGGNCHNTAGGGGSNGNNGWAYNGAGNPDTSTTNWKTAWDLEGNSFHKNISSGGGRGGYSYTSNNPSPITTAPGNVAWHDDHRNNIGGFGGRPLDNNSGNRLFMGGGGGSGDANDGFGSGGSNGGGIVFLLVGGALTGSGTVNANGADGSPSLKFDAAGGAGGGGSVVIYNPTKTSSGITVNAKGGIGGNQQYPSNHQESEGPGGGGGGGYIAISSPNTVISSVSGGKNGTTNSTAMTLFIHNGATMGADGSIGTPINPYSGTVPLPITLLSFSAERKNETAELRWITSSEINNDYFTVERSNDATDFTRIGTMEGAGNSTTPLYYSFTDEVPFSGENYYRLKQTDYDGKFSYSNVIPVRMVDKNAKDVLVLPNPASAYLYLKFNSTDFNASQTIFELYDVIGKNVCRKKIDELRSISGDEFEFDSHEIIPGIYFYRVITISDGTVMKNGRIEIIQ